jgi:DnaJ family protein B protein 4
MGGGMGSRMGMGGSRGMSGGMFGDEDDDMGGFGGGMPDMDGGRANARQGPSSTSPPSEITRPLKISLEELYAGATKHVKVGRKLLSGSTEEKVLEIEVLPGWKPGTKIRFPRVGNEVSGGESADLVFIVEEKPHNVFERVENDLVCKVKIPLVDALAGTPGLGKKVVQTLDGRKLQVAVPEGIVKPDQETRISGEGMPIRKSGSMKKKGDLIVKWEVKFPDRLTPAQKEGIRKVLG